MTLLAKSVETFLVLAEELHFGRAAQRLHTSQPPLSQQIRRLERSLGVLLFERTTRSVRLSVAGEELRARALVLRQDERAALDALRTIATGSGGVVSLGFTSSAAYGRLPAAVSQFRRHLPGFELRLREDDSQGLWQALLDERIDLAILRRHPGMQHRDVAFHPAGRERLVLALPPGHAFGARTCIAVSALERVDFIGFSPARSPYFHDLITRLFAESGVQPRIVHASVMPTLLSLVEAGMGVALVPESAVELWSTRLVVLRLTGPLARTAVAEFDVAVLARRAGRPGVEVMARALVGSHSARVHPLAACDRNVDESVSSGLGHQPQPAAKQSFEPQQAKDPEQAKSLAISRGLASQLEGGR